MRGVLTSRRSFLATGISAGLAGALAACAVSKDGSTTRLAYLTFAGIASPAPRVRFFSTLANAELPPTSKFITDVRFAGFDLTRIDALASEIVAAKPNIIIALWPQTIRALARTGTKTAIVSIQNMDAGDPDFVESLDWPGRNLTGVVAGEQRSLYGRRLELLKEAFPAVRRVAVLIGTGSGRTLNQIHAWQDMRTMAQKLGLSLEPIGVETWQDRAAAAERVRTAGADAMMSVNTAGIVGWGSSGLFELQFALRLPSLLDGVLSILGYGPAETEQFDKAAEMVVSILNGARAGDIPLWTPKMELVANVGIARQLGLTIAPGVLARADRVVQ